ncbi:hypothetical protein R3P38DRAFT_3117755 [Favolaschia claudopus]|uniref:Uncharacterized protein n=1 Tax=Favolaschia claudopus TaxID=2862362 RepID=A0AAV9ZEG0_9AGAR
MYDSESRTTADHDFLSRGPQLTVNGGMGGSGGGGLVGGAGGTGEGPQLHVYGAVGWNVHVNGHLLNYACVETPHSEFRRIPMGDINLKAEICLDRGLRHTVSRRERRNARKLFTAKIEGRRSRYTVALYQGNGAIQEWTHDVAKYMTIRHPYILQIYGISRSGTSAATIFHEDLTSFWDFMQIYRRHFFMLFIYLRASANASFYDAERFLQDHNLTPYGTLLIHRRTGGLCIDLTLGNEWLEEPRETVSLQENILSLSPALQHQIISNSLSFENYHHICFERLEAYQAAYLNIKKKVNLGVVAFWPTDTPTLDDASVAIAFAQGVQLTSCQWMERENKCPTFCTDANYGWDRISGAGAEGTIFSLSVYMASECSWLSQANYIFRRATIMSGASDYSLIFQVRFEIEIFQKTKQAPDGFLWLCPASEFRCGPFSFGWPECPAYWSLDPLGSERLDAKHAEQMGFPSLKLSTTVFGLSWSDIVYAGLGDFHKAKGFDPYSQEVAVHLREPLYQLCSDVGSPFTSAVYDIEEAHSDKEVQSPYTIGPGYHSSFGAQSPAIETNSFDNNSDFRTIVSAPSSFVPYPLHYADLDGLWTTARTRNDSSPSLFARFEQSIDSPTTLETPMPGNSSPESSSTTDELLQPHSQDVECASVIPSISFNDSVTKPQSLLEDVVTLRRVPTKRCRENDGVESDTRTVKRGPYSSRMSAQHNGGARGG